MFSLLFPISLTFFSLEAQNMCEHEGSSLPSYEKPPSRNKHVPMVWTGKEIMLWPGLSLLIERCYKLQWDYKGRRLTRKKWFFRAQSSWDTAECSFCVIIQTFPLLVISKVWCVSDLLGSHLPDGCSWKSLSHFSVVAEMSAGHFPELWPSST